MQFSSVVSLGFKRVREGNQCDRCKKLDTEVGPITYYTDPHDGYKGLLCSECIKKREKPYTEICPKCKRVAYEHGGMSYYGYESSFEDMCLECVEKKEARVAKIIAVKSTIKNFAKDHWKFWISTGLVIIGLVMAYFSFLSTK